MIFESKYFRVVSPLDPDKVDIYVKLVRKDLDDMDLENFYKVTARLEDYINPTTDGKLSWIGIRFYSFDYDKALANW